MTKRSSLVLDERQPRKRLRRGDERNNSQDVDVGSDYRGSQDSEQIVKVEAYGDQPDLHADPDDVIMPNSPQHFQQPVTSSGHISREGSLSEQEIESDRDIQDAPVTEHAAEEDDEQSDYEFQLSKDHGFATSGIIKSIELFRFMNHDRFEFPFGPNVNIINGANGSGKSACVAALQLGFDARARHTERGSRLQDHIMHGKSDAVIVINIHNRKPRNTDGVTSEPDMTYRHDAYGDVISIERRLSKTSNGGWAVKGKNRRHVKLADGVTAHKEVLNIISHFGFMVDNPVAVLTQTRAKAFLGRSNPRELFKFFRDATLLSNLEAELQETGKITKSVTDSLKNKVLSLPDSETKLERLAQEFRDSQEMKNIDSHIASASLIVAWTYFQEEDFRLKDVRRELAEELEPMKETAERDLNESEAKMNAVVEEQRQYQKDVNDHVEVLNQKGQTLKTVKRQGAELRVQKKSLLEKQADSQREVRRLQEKTAAERRKMEQAQRAHFAGQEQKNRLFDDLSAAKEGIRSVEQDISNEENRHAELRELVPQKTQELSRSKDGVSRARERYTNTRSELHRAQSMASRESTLMRFGRDIAELCDIVKRKANDFNRPPIGPIGQYVKVRKQEWAPAMEAAIGQRNLLTFLVHNSHDARLLERMMGRLRRRPMVLITNLDRQRYHIREEDKVVARGHITILDTLHVEADAVYNALVDQCQIERILLFNGNESNVRDFTDLGWSRAPNLKELWGMRCSKAYCRSGSNVFRDGWKNPFAKYLKNDNEQYIQGLKAEAASYGSELTKCEEHLKAWSHAVQSLDRDIHAAKANIGSLRKQESDLRHRVNELETQLNQAENAFDDTPFVSAISAYDETMQREEAEIANVQNQIAVLAEKLEKVAVDGEAANREMVSAKRLVQEYEASMEKAVSKVAKEKSRYRHLTKKKNEAFRRVEEATAAVQQKGNEIAELMENARKLGECPPDLDCGKQSAIQARKEVSRLEKKKKAEERRRGGRSAIEIEAAYLTAKKIDKGNRESITRVTMYKKALTMGLKRRSHKLRELNKLLRKMVRVNFQQFMSAKGHSGRIAFARNENGESELHIHATMVNHNGNQTEDLRQLSGGEKSFTTLALILSLAEICHNPVRVFDEIDVFQDEATRRTAYKTLISFCNEFLSNRQIIIITPHKLPDIQPSPAVFIQKLDAPRPEKDGRRQSRLEFGIAS